MEACTCNPSPDKDAGCYQIDPPSVAERMDRIREATMHLSDCIRAANEAGLKVSVQKSPKGSPCLFQVIYDIF